jgi:hypothetical protein
MNGGETVKTNDTQGHLAVKDAILARSGIYLRNCILT